MTAKELIVGSALLVGASFVAAVATSNATQAQGYFRYWYGHGYGGLYDYYGAGPSGLVARPNRDRGGPGPRVRDGSGMGIGAER
jgi:hypothetical protein